MEKAGLNDMALYIKYTSDDLSVWDEYKYLNEGGEEYGLWESQRGKLSA